MVDALWPVLGQLGAALPKADAVLADIGQVEGAVGVGNKGMPVGQHTVAVRNGPVAVLRATDDAAGLPKGLAGREPGGELLGADDF
ncbi:hypothetical protein D9M70_625270 [compost metagenome]